MTLLASGGRRRRLDIDRLPAWALALGFLLFTVTVGPKLGGIIRPVFILGCGALAWHTWRTGVGAHLSASLLLFAFAPFARRVVDSDLGYNESGIMLVGPLLALLVPAMLGLLDLLRSSEEIDRRYVPLAIVAGCIAYAAGISLLYGSMMDAISGILKWLTPVLYAAALMHHSDRDEVLEAGARTFSIILPLTGLYGILQYLDPPEWDRYWMQFAPIISIGQPVPFGVRTFSTLNSPASYATFTAVGLLLVAFIRPRWTSILIAAPAVLGLLLSLYRTAWISLALGIIFCLAFKATRRQAGGIMIALIVGGMIATVLPPFSDVIADRLATLGQGSGDGSAQERLVQYYTLWNISDSSVFGTGFTTTDVGAAGEMPIDGMIIACWLMMGVFVGLICLTGFGLAIGRAMSRALTEQTREAVVVGGLALGALAQLPLANLSSAEMGFLFWTFMVLTPRENHWGRVPL